MSLRIGSKWVNRFYLKRGEWKGIEIKTDKYCLWWGLDKPHEENYSENAVRGNFLEIPEELENEPYEVIKLYLAL